MIKVTLFLLSMLVLLWVSAGAQSTYTAGGFVMGPTPQAMSLRFVVDTVTFSATDSTAVVQLNLNPTETRHRTAPSSIDKIQLIGAGCRIQSYDARTGIVTLKAMIDTDSTVTTVMFMVR